MSFMLKKLCFFSISPIAHNVYGNTPCAMHSYCSCYACIGNKTFKSQRIYHSLTWTTAVGLHNSSSSLSVLSFAKVVSARHLVWEITQCVKVPITTYWNIFLNESICWQPEMKQGFGFRRMQARKISLLAGDGNVQLREALLFFFWTSGEWMIEKRMIGSLLIVLGIELAEPFGIRKIALPNISSQGQIELFEYQSFPSNAKTLCWGW